MEAGKIIVVVIVALIALSLFIYASFTSKEKGPILSNGWIFASKTERRFIDKSAEYHLVTVVFRWLGVIFTLVAAYILTNWTWLPLVIGGIILLLLVYVIRDAIKTEAKK